MHSFLIINSVYDKGHNTSEAIFSGFNSPTKINIFFLMSVLGAKQGQIKNLVALEFKYDKLIDTKNNVDLLRNKIINWNWILGIFFVKILMGCLDPLSKISIIIRNIVHMYVSTYIMYVSILVKVLTITNTANNSKIIVTLHGLWVARKLL